jgi:hypothetical protein
MPFTSFSSLYLSSSYLCSLGSLWPCYTKGMNILGIIKELKVVFNSLSEKMENNYINIIFCISSQGNKISSATDPYTF